MYANRARPMVKTKPHTPPAKTCQGWSGRISAIQPLVLCAPKAGRAKPESIQRWAELRVNANEGSTGHSANVSPCASMALSRAEGLSSSGSISNCTVIIPWAQATETCGCKTAYCCCSCRRTNSWAVFTRVKKADMSKGLGFFLSRPMVHGPTKAGSLWPALNMATAQPSSSSFLITRAVHSSFCHRRASCAHVLSSFSICKWSPVIFPPRVSHKGMDETEIMSHTQVYAPV